MSTVGQPERATQNRVIALLRDELRYGVSVTSALTQGMVLELLTERTRLA